MSRFTVETRVLGQVLMRLVETDDADDVVDLMTRFSILYDVYCPPPKRSKKGSHGA